MVEVWKFMIRKTGGEKEAALVAHWEVSHDPISDGYTPQEADAKALFNKWVTIVSEKYPDGLVPIHWSVCSEEPGTFEFMPFQFNHIKYDEDFLTHFTWPVHAVSGEPLNLLALPVIDKLWNTSRADKGGFIQEATGWKPSILQPYVYLPALKSIFQSH